jgi:hypothetical protein
MSKNKLANPLILKNTLKWSEKMVITSKLPESWTKLQFSGTKKTKMQKNGRYFTLQKWG